MRRLLAAIALAAVVLPAPSALGWGSMTSGGIWPARFNTHGCLDRMAYAFLQKDPAFTGSGFPTLEQIQAHEGINYEVKGEGPDSEGSSQYSWHYYNPRNHQGGAPGAVADNFLVLGYRQTGREKAAAWGAHFLADTNVPYHINGEEAAIVGRAMDANPPVLNLPQIVTGDRALLSGTNLGAVVSPFAGPHGPDFKREAARFLAGGGNKGHLDWFDPWYWTGTVDSAAYVDSSHIVWEGLSPECPANAVDGYSVTWPGNPVTQFGDPSPELRRVATSFTTANAQSTADNVTGLMARPGAAEAMAATSIATLWRASFSALRLDQTTKFDATTLTDPNQTPIAEVRGRISNTALETARGVQVRVRQVSGNCRLMSADTAEVQTLGDAPTGSRSFGVWKIQTPRGGRCRMSIEAIGRYLNTPDLQLAWRNFYLTAPDAPAQPPPCNCKPGDFMCETLCKHDPNAHR